MARILVVEDNPDIALALATLLTRNGHEVTRAADGVEALRVAYDLHPQLVVLDIGLPKLDGWGVLSRIRELSDIPVLLLTAAGRDEDKVRGLRGGADDYLTKPFHNAELVARIDGLLRRAGDATWTGSDLGHGRIVLSPTRHAVTVDGSDVSVTPLEFDLLSMFLRHEGQVLTPTQILSAVWADHSGGGQERVKFAVLRLRRKVGWDDATTSPLKSVRGIGYRLDPPA
ncbi:MAG TPA: response regulator transcription factor [Ornithinibacter sp.]|nr:response regulator transcription factor [Ornithinibacter sp.]